MPNLSSLAMACVGLRHRARPRLCASGSAGCWMRASPRSARGDPAAAAAARWKPSSPPCARAGGAAAREANEQHYEVPAAFFGAGAGPAPQVQQLLLARRRPRLGRRRGRGAGRHLRARRPGRRPGRARTGLRLGFADAVDGDALPGQPHHRACRTRTRSARTSRAEAAAPGLRNVRGRHLRHQRLRHRRRASTAWCRSRCSSTCATGRGPSPAWRAGCEPTGRFFMHVFAHRGAPYAFEERDASDWMSRAFLLRRHDAQRRPRAALPATTCGLLHAAGAGTARTTQRTAEAWLRNMDDRDGDADAAVPPDLRRRQRRHVVDALAAVLPVGAPSCSASTAGSAWWVEPLSVRAHALTRAMCAVLLMGLGRTGIALALATLAWRACRASDVQPRRPVPGHGWSAAPALVYACCCWPAAGARAP